MSDIVERVAKAISTCANSQETKDGVYLLAKTSTSEHVETWLTERLARAAISAIQQDDDIQALLRWLDFKQSGKGPGDQEWNGAKKLLAAFGFEP